jgi:hypothetical protein
MVLTWSCGAMKLRVGFYAFPAIGRVACAAPGKPMAGVAIARASADPDTGVGPRIRALDQELPGCVLCVEMGGIDEARDQDEPGD